MRWIQREALERQVEAAVRDYPVTLLVGARQCGKTTLARRLAGSRRGAFFDLEDPETPLRAEAAKAVLSDLRGLVVIDEVQRQPSLLPLLRVLADRRPLPARFLILGSASPTVAKGASEWPPDLRWRVRPAESRGRSPHSWPSAAWPLGVAVSQTGFQMPPA